MINEPNLTIDQPQMHQNPKSFKKPGLHFRQSRNGAVEKYPNEKDVLEKSPKPRYTYTKHQVLLDVLLRPVRTWTFSFI